MTVKDMFWDYCFMLLLILAITAFAYSKLSGINEDDAVDAIVGEASNQSYDTMICVAQAIRNRGTLKGVYGLHARHNYAEKDVTWDAARDAWEESAWQLDVINHAKNFGTLQDLTKLKIKPSQVLAACGDFYFY